MDVIGIKKRNKRRGFQNGKKKKRKGQLSRDNELLQGKGSRRRKQQWSSELLPQQERTWSEDMTTLVRQSGSGSPCWSKHKLLGGPIDKTFYTFLSSQPICDKPWSVAVGSLIKTIQTMDMQLIMHIRVPRTRRKLMTLSRIVPSGRTTMASCRVKKRAWVVPKAQARGWNISRFFCFYQSLWWMRVHARIHEQDGRGGGCVVNNMIVQEYLPPSGTLMVRVARSFLGMI